MPPTLPESVLAYAAALPAASQDLYLSLATTLLTALPGAQAKVWHGAPVWFVAGEPCLGLTHGKRGIQLLFWSGQLFDEPLLVATGKFKAAEFVFTAASDADPATLARWIGKATTIVWDYPGELKKLRAAAKC